MYTGTCCVQISWLLVTTMPVSAYARIAPPGSGAGASSRCATTEERPNVEVVISQGPAISEYEWISKESYHFQSFQKIQSSIS